MKQKFNVTGMTCSACSLNVEKSVKKLNGVKSVNVNLLSNNMTVLYDEVTTDSNEIIKAVKSAGYGASDFSESKTVKADAKINNKDNIREMKIRLIVSFSFLLPLLYIAMGHMINLPLPMWLHGTENAVTFSFIQLLLILPIMYVNRKYYIGGFKALFHRAPNMDSLIAIGSLAAVLYGVFAIFSIGYGLGHNIIELVNRYTMDLYFESAGMILSLITLGKFLESRSKGKTSEAISKLMNLTPLKAIVLRDNVEIEIPIEEVVINDILIVKSGQSIPVDGIIIEGEASIDQSALTGESIPTEKFIGDKVNAATINKNGYLKIRAEKVGDDTTLAKIIALVEEASSSKAPIAKLADKISGIFVPVVISIAIISFIVWLIAGQTFEFALSIAIAVLVISCPCALGLATPVAIMVGTGQGALNGILIKSAEALETAHSINTVVLDKTGTITEGKPRVTDIITIKPYTEKKLIEIAASLENFSEHPLAEAIILKAKEMNVKIIKADKFTSALGKGISAFISGNEYSAGNINYMNEKHIDVSALSREGESLAENGKTPLYFSDNKAIIGIIAVADIIKPTSLEAIKRFKEMGIDVMMLTGDNRRTANAIQKQLGIDKVFSEVLPEDKERIVRDIMNDRKKVAMIGDGINDSPALARADVGIAIGAGTDIAIDSADIVLMKSDLLDAVTSIELSKAVIVNIKQNLFWAFFYNIIGIPLAAGLFYPFFQIKLNPMFGAAAMSLSSIFVVSNALRLKLFKTKRRIITDEIKDTINNEVLEGEGENDMKKVLIINGMMCDHCKNKVESALNSISGVDAKVDLKNKSATIKLKSDVSDEKLKAVVTAAGYEVEEIKK